MNRVVSCLSQDGEASAGSLEKKLLGSRPQGNSHHVYAKFCPFLKSSGKEAGRLVWGYCSDCQDCSLAICSDNCSSPSPPYPLFMFTVFSVQNVSMKKKPMDLFRK